MWSHISQTCNHDKRYYFSTKVHELSLSNEPLILQMQFFVVFLPELATKYPVDTDE